MKRKFLLWIIPSLLLMMGFFVGCNDESDNYEPEWVYPDAVIEELPKMQTGDNNESAIETITPVLIGQGDLYGNGREGFDRRSMVITNSNAWEALKADMDSYNKVSDSFTETDIDFSEYQIIAVFDEIKGNGGWSIDVVNITEHGKKIEIRITNLKTGNLSSVITQPFHIIKIPATDKRIEFVMETKTEPKTIIPILIGKGNLYGGGKEGFDRQNMIITNNEAWEELKVAMDSYYYKVPDSFSETDIDFSKYQVIALFDEVKGNGGWTIDIVNITEYGSKIEIEITNLETGNASSVITQPYHIAKIPVSDKEVVFIKDLYSYDY